MIQFAVFIFAKIKYLVDKTLKNLRVFIGDSYKSLLLRSEVFSRCKLRHGFGDECERRAEVVRHVGEEHKLRLCGILELLVEKFLLVALFL